MEQEVSNVEAVNMTAALGEYKRWAVECKRFAAEAAKVEKEFRAEVEKELGKKMQQFRSRFASAKAQKAKFAAILNATPEGAKAIEDYYK